MQRILSELAEARRRAAVCEHKMHLAEERAELMHDRLRASHTHLTLATHQMGAARPTRLGKPMSAASALELSSPSFASNTSSIFDSTKWEQLNDRYRPTTEGSGRPTTPQWEPKNLSWKKPRMRKSWSE